MIPKSKFSRSQTKQHFTQPLIGLNIEENSQTAAGGVKIHFDVKKFDIYWIWEPGIRPTMFRDWLDTHRSWFCRLITLERPISVWIYLRSQITWQCDFPDSWTCPLNSIELIRPLLIPCFIIAVFQWFIPIGHFPDSIVWTRHTFDQFQMFTEESLPYRHFRLMELFRHNDWPCNL
jgi:hypothetical protein